MTHPSAARILLLEDDTAHAELIGRVFSAHADRYRLLVADCLAAAHRLMAETPPDLVLADYRLPDGSGLELIVPVGPQPAYPVVVMTSHGDEQVAVGAIKAGAMDYVVKSEHTFYDLPHIVDRNLRQWHHIQGRQEAERALRESERKYRLVVDHCNDAILIIQDGIIRFTNRTAVDMFGYPSATLKGSPWLELVYADDRAAAARVAETPRRPETREGVQLFRIVREQGDWLWVEPGAVTVAWEGRPARLLFIRDVTEKKKLEYQLAQAQKMEAIGTLAGGIAHDFNNILGAIVGYSEMALFRLADGSDERRYLEEVLQAAFRARDLVKQILTFSRKSEQIKKPFSLTGVVSAAVKLLRASLPASIEIRQILETRLDVVMGDQTQIHQVVMNLCTNAAHAMEPNGGVLEIGLYGAQALPENVAAGRPQRGGWVKLTVKDTGRGIAREDLPRIFDPYFTTKESGKGTGMGLAVVHGIVESHNGVITVQSEIGGGSLFEVFLPRVGGAEAESPAGAAEPLQGGSGRILLVDDEEMLANVGRQMLNRLGYTVTATTDSLEALALFRKRPDAFDLVITDMTMPKLTGDKLAVRLKAIRADVPIILCTGYSQHINAPKARALGLQAVVMKPLSLKVLGEAVRQALTPGSGDTD